MPKLMIDQSGRPINRLVLRSSERSLFLDCRYTCDCSASLTLKKVTIVFETISNRMQAFERGVESWKADHDLAMSCMDFETLLQGSIALHEAIESLHASWRKRVRSGHAPSVEFDRVIWKLNHRWLAKCDSIHRDILGLESQGFDVEKAVEFRRLWRDTADAMEQWSEPKSEIGNLRADQITIASPADVQSMQWDEPELPF